MKRTVGPGAVFACCCVLPALSSAADPQAANLGDLSIEELMNESITSVTKKEQRIADAPAAIYVLTGEEILRAGFSSIPEALRMVPGLSVAQLDSQNWIVTARGFAAQYAGKLLVLIDGRTVYDPFYSGVLWSRQDLPLEDIDRIEVIRGPGAALWGANAVNGVINIITKSSQETQGNLAVASWGGTKSYAAVQSGGEIGDGHYRAYMKYDDYASLKAADGTTADDPWHVWRAGFRTDWRSSTANQQTVQGDIYSGTLRVADAQTSLTPPYSSISRVSQGVSGGNILGRWQHAGDERSRWSLQAYYDRTELRDPVFIGFMRDTFDLEFQHQMDVGTRQTVVYGGGYRFTQARYSDSYYLTYAHERDSQQLVNVFGQDEIAVVPDRLELILGSKLEHNDFTGLEVQPSVRLMWTPDSSNSIWADVSRAVRTPDLLETGLRVNYAAFDAGGTAPPTVLSILPNPALRSERLVAYELGYRTQPARSVFVDVVTFFNVYRDLVTTGTSTAFVEAVPPPAHLVIGSVYNNAMRGNTYGLEVAPTWQVAPWWKLAAGYTWLHMTLNMAGTYGAQPAGDSPKHQAQIRSSMQWLRHITFDTAFYYVDSLPDQGVASYMRLDARLGWSMADRLDLSVGGSNLLDPRHVEFRSFTAVPVEIERTVYAKVAWRF
jgi:iron complex outermembrane recepter protein